MLLNYKLLFVTFLISGTYGYAQTGPGGVGDNNSNIFWLDANEIPTGTYADGDNLDNWVDVSGNNLDLSQPNPIFTPEYRTGVLNGYPVVRFTKANGRLRRTGIANFPTSAITTFIVNQNVGESNDALMSYASAGDFNDFLLFQSNNRQIFRNGISLTSGVSSNDGNWHIIDVNWRGSDGDTRIWMDGTQRYSATFQTGTSITANGSLAIAAEQDAIDGNYEATQNHLGDYAEVLMYDFSLNQAQRIIVANYLGAKYNIPMAGNDYFAYQATHSIDVAGIGRETTTDIHTAAMSDRIFQVENPSGLNANKEYLIFGHDDADITTAWTTTEIPTSSGTSVQRLAREWRFSEINGDVGTIDFKIDIATLPVLPVGFSKYVLMIDADGDFTTGAEVYELGIVAGTTYELSGINIADGDFVAIAIVDPEVQFTLDQSNDFEPNNALVSIELNYIPRVNVTVDYTTADLTAIAADYTGAATVQATILAGTNATIITIPITNDGIVEPDESFTITLSNPSVGTSLGAQTVHTYTINDDDDARKIYFNLSANSGDESISPAIVNITMSSISATNVTVDYTVTGGTATAGVGNDYVLAAGTVTIVGGSGATTSSFSININDDAIYELSETIIIKLSNPQGCNLDLPSPANVGTGFISHTYTIIDNDTPPEIQFDATNASGDEAVASVTIPVSLNSTSQVNASVTFTVADVTATNGSDYIFSSGTITINAGATTSSIIASIIDDTNAELPETFTVTLSAPSNAILGANSVFTYTIVDNDNFGYLGPGGIGDNLTNKLWVMADKDIYNNAGTTLSTDGQTVEEWHDQSGNNNHLSQPNNTFKPHYRENIVNGKPTMRFDVSNNRIRKLAFNDFPTTSISTYAVANTSINNDALVSYAVASDNNHYLLFNSGSFSTYIAGSNVNTGQTYNDGNWHITGHTWTSSDGENKLYKDGSQIYSGILAKGLDHTGGGSLAIAGEQDNVDAGYAANQDYEGDIAETIIYNAKLNSAQRKILNNYLGAKYDLTIANDYFAYETPFGNEVVGIGRDDIQNFHLDAQGQGLVRMNNPSSLNDGDFLIWGHNDVDLHTGAYLAPWVGLLPPGVNNSLHRLWRVDETGEIGTVTVKFDISGLTIGAVNDLVLLIDSDDGDIKNATVIPLTSFTAPYANFDGVNFSAGDWFTLGSISDFNSLPIELISFDAKLNGSLVDLKWQTASEINNDYFSVQRSNDGTEWETIAVLDGAGNSTSVLNYTATDNNPIYGKSFYRLKQTDYNGDFTYSKIQIITYYATQATEIIIYPNPTNDKITIEGNQEEVITVTILNSLGQDVTRVTELQNQNNTTWTVDLSNLSKGVYFIKTKTSVTKVYKQ